jgi:hypothetical protein
MWAGSRSVIWMVTLPTVMLATLRASQVIDTDNVTDIVVSAKDDVQDANDAVVLQAANQAY